MLSYSDRRLVYTPRIFTSGHVQPLYMFVYCFTSQHGYAAPVPIHSLSCSRPTPEWPDNILLSSVVSDQPSTPTVEYVVISRPLLSPS